MQMNTLNINIDQAFLEVFGTWLLIGYSIFYMVLILLLYETFTFINKHKHKPLYRNKIQWFIFKIKMIQKGFYEKESNNETNS